MTQMTSQEVGKIIISCPEQVELEVLLKPSKVGILSSVLRFSYGFL